MKLKQFIEWVATLPPEFQEAELEAIVHNYPSTLKRIVAYRYKDNSGIGIVANPMGTRIYGNFEESCNIVSIL